MRQRLSRGYALQLEAVPVFLLFLCFYLAASNYGVLPDRVPTHFDIRGVPDQWGGKGEIWIGAAVSAGAYALFTVITAVMAAVENPMSLINLPATRREKISMPEAEELRTAVIRSLFIMKSCIAGLSAYLTWNTVEIAFNRSPLPVWPLFALIAVILLSAASMTVKALRAGMGRGRYPAR